MAVRTHASVRIPLPAETVWSAVRRFDFPARLNSTIESVELEGGASSTAVGAVRHVVWKSGEKQSSRLLSIDDAFLTTRWELVGSEPAAEVSAAISTLRVFSITEDQSSLVDWQVDYSADAAPAFLRFQQEAQLESLREIRAVLLSNRPAGGGLRDVFHSLRQGAKPSLAQLTALWDKYDANQDGNLDLAETSAMITDIIREKRRQLPAILQQQIDDLGPAALILTPALAGVRPMADAALAELENQFTALDDNLFATEFRSRFDLNGDGKVTKDEFLARAAELIFVDLLQTPAARALAAPIQSPLPEEGFVTCAPQ